MVVPFDIFVMGALASLDETHIPERGVALVVAQKTLGGYITSAEPDKSNRKSAFKLKVCTSRGSSVYPVRPFSEAGALKLFTLRMMLKLFMEILGSTI